MGLQNAINTLFQKITGGFTLGDNQGDASLTVTGGTIELEGGATIADGDLLIGNAADNKFEQGQLAAGTGMSVTPSAGGLSIATTITQYTDELAQDAVGGMVDTTLVYVDGTPVLKRAPITGDVTIADGSNTAAIGSGVIVNADVNGSAAIALNKLAATTVSRALVSDGSGVVSPATTTATEIGYVNGVTSAIQTQLNAKQASDATLTALASYNTNGLITQTAADTFTGRTITGTTNKIGVTNGDGVSGNPTLNIGSDVVTLTDTQTLTNKTLTSPKINENVALTPTSTELNYVGGVTSAIQTQLDNKWWQELGSTSNSGSAAIAVNSFAARKYLKIILTYSPSTGAQVGFQFNGDTGNNYGFTFNNPFGGAFSASVTASSTNKLAVSDTGGINQIGEFNVINIATKQKGLNGQMGGGTSTAIAGRLAIGAWNNTSDQITSVNLFIASGNLGDAEMTILGHD